MFSDVIFIFKNDPIIAPNLAYEMLMNGVL